VHDAKGDDHCGSRGSAQRQIKWRKHETGERVPSPVPTPGSFLPDVKRELTHRRMGALEGMKSRTWLDSIWVMLNAENPKAQGTWYGI